MTLIFGTWKLDPRYNKIKNIYEASNLIDYSISMGIHSFDTASVYANQEIEKILGKYSNEKLDIISKIPARKKISFFEKKDALDLYPNDWLEKYIFQSTENLNRNDYTMLLHNFGYWENIICVLEKLEKYKRIGMFSKIGISIPNNFRGKISKSIIDKVDTIELPYNSQNQWIVNNIEELTQKRILIRSLFKDYQNGVTHKIAERLISNSLQYSDDLIIGMTKKYQVKENNIIFNNCMNKKI